MTVRNIRITCSELSAALRNLTLRQFDITAIVSERQVVITRGSWFQMIEQVERAGVTQVIQHGREALGLFRVARTRIMFPHQRIVNNSSTSHATSASVTGA